MIDAPVRLAMIGGGPGSFIGPVHRMAAELDARIRLVAGAFSRDAGKSLAAGAAWGLAPERCYADAATLIAQERARPDGAELIAIVTPNHLHFPLADAALQAGYHVMSDKPAALDLAEALSLSRTVARSGRLYGLTYVYSGYPAIREARDMIARGDLGAIRKIVVEYSQGWLSRPIEQQGDKQAAWRADPGQAGVGGCIGDIGVHAFHLAEYVSGHRVERLCADVAAVVPGRALDDDCNMLLRFTGGARGVLIASQISAGARNNLRIAVYGEKGGLSWMHERPNELTVDWLEGPTQIFHVGTGHMSPAATAVTRLPAGHPEGFIEAFANLYADFATAIRAGEKEAAGVPGITEGVRGMAFVETAVGASRDGRGWVDLEVAA